MMNFSVSDDDLQRFSSADDLKHFYTNLGLNGLELMPLSKDTQGKVNPDMVVGVHLCCASDWMVRITHSGFSWKTYGGRD